MPTQTTTYTAALDNDNVQRTYLNKTYYDKNLLEMAKTKFVHAEYGQKRTIPKGQGKKVEFRRWTPFDPKLALAGLTEGVTPDAQDLAQTHLEVTCKQYGAYVEVSDLLQTTAYDDIMSASTDMLGEQLGTVIEWITRDAMCAGTNVQYADGQTSRKALTASKVLTTTEIRKAVRTLKKAKARTFTRQGGKPHFICICSPDAVYDLQSDTMWQDVSKYSNKEAIYSGEIGQLFGVVFVESTESKVYEQSVCNAVNAATNAATAFVLKNTPTEKEAAYLSTGGNKIKIGSTEYTLATTGSYTASTKTVTLSAAATLTEDAVVFSEDAGAPVSGVAPDVHAALVFGKDSYGVVDINGEGTVQSIVKGLGSAGSGDPLDQRATVGGKVASYACTILNNDWLVRIEHGVSA